MPQKSRFLAPLALACLLFSLSQAEDGHGLAVSSTVILKTSEDAAGQPVQYPNGQPELTGVLVQVPAGSSTGWHIHPCSCIGYILEGQITVEQANGTRKSYKTGDCFAEVRQIRHRGHNEGPTPTKILLFALGEKGLPVSQASAP